MYRQTTRLVALAALLVPLGISGQEGTIAFDRVVKFEFELPPGIPERFRQQIPEQDVTPMVLHFDATASLMRPSPEAEARREEQAARVRDGAGGDRAVRAGGGFGRGRGGGMLQRLRMSSTDRNDVELIDVVHVETATGAMTESRTFMGRDFLIEDTRPQYAWRLTADQARHLGYMVQKATAEHDGHQIEAWFTPQIPVMGGPAQYGGLPGMILVVSIDDGRLMYSATAVDLDGLEPGTIAPPSDGDEMTPEEYEVMVEEKLEERRRMMRQRRRRGGGS